MHASFGFGELLTRRILCVYFGEGRSEYEKSHERLWGLIRISPAFQMFVPNL